MSPLLPEYLGQSFCVLSQVIIEAPAPPISSWLDLLPIIVGAISTILGAALGAGLGAKYAYTSTVKANNELLKRQKLEEALTIVLDAKGSIDLAHETALQSGWCDFDGVGNNKITEDIKKIDYKNIQRLETLLKLYGGCMASDANALCLSVGHLHAQVRSSEAFNERLPDIREITFSCLSKINRLEGELTNRLRL